MNKINNSLIRIMSCTRCGSELSVKRGKITCPNNHFYEIDKRVPIMTKLNSYLEKEANAWGNKWENEVSKNALYSYKFNMKIFKKLGYWEENGSVASKIPSNKNNIVLDLGCGNGVSTAHIKGKTVVGLDLSRSQLIKAKNNFNSNYFVVGNAESLPFKDETFDLIVAINIFHHITNTKKCLKECWRVLKKGGKLISVDPNLYNPIGFIGRGLYRLLHLNKIFPAFPQFALGEEEKQFSKKMYYDLFTKSPFLKYKIKPHRIERVLFFSTILFPFLIKVPGYKELLLMVSKIGNKIVQIKPFDQICYFWIAEAKK